MELWFDQTLPERLYRAAEVRELDRFAIEEQGIPGSVLMQRAGLAAFELLRHKWPKAHRIAVLCGGGNNGGDGYVVARLACDARLEVTVFAAAPPEKLKGDARWAFEAYRESGGKLEEGIPSGLEGFDLLVDALLGTGLDREVTGPFAEAIRVVNRTSAGKLAIDIPSGLHADTGAILGCAVEADATVTFIGLKRGLWTGEGPACCGEIYYSDLAVPQEILDHVPPSAKRLRWPGGLPKRRRTAHKGHFGHVLVIGGMPGFSGAARMAGEAALRVGAGLVSIATHPHHAAVLNLGRPELMVHPVETPADLDWLLERATVIALGPGLGQSDWSLALWEKALTTELPLVVDADGLNLLARRPKKREDWILTPHPGEAARLLETTPKEIQRDRFAALEALLDRYGGTVVLKGAGTLVGRKGEVPAICPYGHPGMASGGMGDVLTGVIAGLLAQGVERAAEFGTMLHALAADDAAHDEERGLLATDLLPWLRRRINDGKRDNTR